MSAAAQKMEGGSNSPLFTPRHSHHSAVWCIAGYSIPKLCIACATERLENYSKGELNIHIKKILGEFQALLDSCTHARNPTEPTLLSVVSSDQRVVEHICGLLFGLLVAPDVSIAQSAVEVLMTLLGLMKSQEISRKILQKAVQSVMVSPNLPSSLPHLNLLGRLLYSQQFLISEVLHSYGSLLEFSVTSLSYPDEKVKSSVVYLLVQSMCRYISTNLATAKSHELTINMLGLVRHLLKSSSYTQCLLEADRLNSEAKGATFASAFKRVLLSQDELLQLSGVQCIAEVLSGHPDYGKVLLNADIAEFLFEALSSKSELLLNSLFYCLNSLASLEEFYSRYHVIYGMDAIVTGLSTIVKLRSYNTVHMCLNLLTKVLARQPAGMLLFKTHSALQTILDLLTPLLEIEDLTGHASSTLAALISAQHVPQNFPVRSLLTPLAHLLSQIEPLLSPVTESMANAWTRVGDVLLCVERAARLMTEVSREAAVVCWREEDREFLLSAFTESLIPVSLLNLDHLDKPEPFTLLLSIALHLFQMLATEEAVVQLARKLCGSGFIQLVMELKAKFTSTIKGVSELCTVGNQFLERLCVILEGDSSPERVIYTRDTLQQSLPSINCSPIDCLQILNQRVQMSGRGTQPGSSGLQSTQAAVLCLFYAAYTNDDLLVPQNDLLRSLDLFLALNPNLHLLPLFTLSHIVVLYAISDGISVGSESHSSVIGDVALNRPSGVAILTRGLQRVADVDSLFAPHTALLRWSLCQWGGESSIVRSWLLKWIRLKPSYSEELLGLLRTSQSALESVIRLVCDPGSAAGVDTGMISKLVQRVLFTSQSSSLSVRLCDCVKSVILEQRIQPLPDSVLSVMFSLLVTTQQNEPNFVISDLKLIYHITNILLRVDDVSDDGHSISDETMLVQFGIQLLITTLRHQTPSSQITQLLLNNQSLLQKLSTFLPQNKNAKAHTPLSAAVMEIITRLISLHQRTHSTVGDQNTVLDAAPLMSALLSTNPIVQIAGLKLWTVVFSRGGKSSPFVIWGVNPEPHKRVRVLCFLLQNCLLNGNVCVAKVAADCFVQLTKYSASLSMKSGSSWGLSMLQHTTDVYSSSTIPAHVVSALCPILQSLSVDSEVKGHLQHCYKRILHPLSQLLYKSLLSVTPTPIRADNQELVTCLLEIRKLDSNCLDESQWKTVTQI